nr:DNA mismatch repair protein Msh3-like isoform X1 [Nothobranchius furzeri]XP_054594794.1 DNA mismatch repair protein Msh3-like isoform X1 [Nothobranchius furzeri]
METVSVFGTRKKSATKPDNEQKEEEQEEIMELSASEDFLSDSSHDLDSDYIPSAPPSSEDELTFSQPKLMKTHDALKNPGKTSLSQSYVHEQKTLMDSGKSNEALDMHYNADTEEENPEEYEDDEEPDILTQRPTRAEPSDDHRQTAGKRVTYRGKGPRKKVEPAEDSDDQGEPLSQCSKYAEPSEDIKKKYKIGTYKVKRSRKIVESPEDSHDETAQDQAELLSQSSKSAEPTEGFKKKKKTGTYKGKRPRKIVESAEDSDDQAKLLSQSSKSAEPTEGFKKKKKTELDQLLLTKQGVKKRPWSSAEKAAVWRQLGKYITLETIPGKVP